MEEIWNEYLHVVLDPGHILAELTFLFIDIVIIRFLIWPFIIKPIVNKVMTKHHAEFDQQHGLTHIEDTKKEPIPLQSTDMWGHG